ncbi:MAG TPA: Fur family transcriptional regulator [Anaerolineae bacterium]
MTDQAKELGNVLQQSGYRLTSARQAILEVLVASGGHVSADELAERVREQTPGTGRMTVYRTLDLLSELGLIRPVYQGTGAAHYILLDDGHHHHLICSNCDRVIEFDECILQEIEQVIGNRFNFQVQGHLLEFYGRCQGCQDEERPATLDR